jgi:hypothetical protein
VIAQDFVVAGWSYLDRRSMPPLNKRIEFARDERLGVLEPWFGKFPEWPPEFHEGVKGWWWRLAKE